MRCESRDYRQKYCETDTRGGAHIVNQLSDTACIEGRTWGVDQHGLWVRGGCRGEFELGRGSRSGGGLPSSRSNYEPSTIVCESHDNRYRHCPVRIRREADLVRRLSRSDCVYSRSWGYDVNGIWVDRGCRGEFAV